MATPRVLTRVLPKDRLEQVDRRLNEISGGSSEKLAQMSDPDKGGVSIDLRLEIRYLLKLKAELQHGGNVAVETVIAGRPDEVVRRVFARITRDESADGETFDLYTKERSRRFSPVLLNIETDKPTRRRARKETP